MHLVKVQPSRAAGNSDTKITNKGAGSIIGTVVATVVTSGTSAVWLLDSVAGNTTGVVLIANGMTPGVYTIPLNAQSRIGDWWVQTAAGVQCTVSTPTPNRAYSD